MTGTATVSISMTASIAIALAAAAKEAGMLDVGNEIITDYLKQAKNEGYLTRQEEKQLTEWQEKELSTLYPNEEDEKTSRYEEHYEETLAAEKEFLNNVNPSLFEFDENQTVGEMLQPPTENYDEEQTVGIGGEATNDIEDKTDENLGINTIDWVKWAEDERNARWEREDAIRKETQEREDTAYQRAVADMRKAGINPNLVGASPAASGGGITQASGTNLDGLMSSMNIDAEKIMQLIENEFKGDEATKDRFMDVFAQIIQTVGLIMAVKAKGK